ncbi:MAG: efflux RND transporter permease subunit [Prevotella sp.]|nr:efflux RND transporter permease subunit [Prevotella sp.]MBR0263852.1 efflux RND transporter permease subunit [Prevotella sp.]
MISRFFISRPIFACALSVLVLIAGIVGYVNLPVEQFPNVAPPVVTINTEYIGASAEAVMKSVITPIEEAINGVEGMEYITSSSTSSGAASISVTFRPGTDPDLAQIRVKNRVEEAKGYLPAEVLSIGVQVEKEEQGMLRIIALECPDNRYDNAFITNYFNINVQPRLQRIAGVGNIQLMGSVYGMRIWMDPKKMAQYQLNPEDVVNVLDGQNVEAAIGTLGEDSKGTYQYTLVYRGRLETPQEFEDIVIKSNGNYDLHLSDVAHVELGTVSYACDSWVNSHNGTIAIITPATGANAQRVNHEIDRLMENLKPKLPAGLEFRVLLDTNDFLDASMNAVYKTLFEALLLVIIVVLLFLQNWRATIIPSVSIIVSLVGTFAFMYMVGFTLNLITLFALVLVIGTVVDDAIVVVEAVQEKLEGASTTAKIATTQAMHNISTAIITTTIVFMCVFIPAAFMGGLSGAYYRQFGLTMAVAVAISTFCALTLCPALCALLMKPRSPETEQQPTSWSVRFRHAYNKAFDALLGKYSRAMGWFIRRRWLVGVLTAVSIVLLAWMLNSTPTGLVPDEDTGIVFVDITTPAGSTLSQTEKTVKEMSEILENDPDVRGVGSVAGWNILGGEGANTGLVMGRLKHWDDRQEDGHDIFTIYDRIEGATHQVKSGSMFVFLLPTVFGYSYSNSVELYVEDFGGGSITKLKSVTDDFIKALEARPEIEEAYSPYEVNYPQYTVTVNASLCKHYGVEPATVLSVLNGYIGGNYASQFNSFGKLYHVMLQSDPALRMDRDDLNNILVVTQNGAYTPITELITLKKTYGLQSLNRFNLFQGISVELTPAEGYTSGDVIDAVSEVSAATLPQGYGYEYTGTAREEASSSSSTAWVFAISLMLVFIVLCCLYESLLIPLAVMLSVPFGLVGSFMLINLAELENNIYMQVGIIMLIGLLAKTAILITEYACERRREGMTIVEAAFDAAKARLRPILMTALTLVVGLMPMIFERGAGAMGNVTLGLCVVGGMLVGTLALLLFVPVFFIFFQTLEEKIKTHSVTTTLSILAVVCLLSSCKTYSSYHSDSTATDVLKEQLSAIGESTTDDALPAEWREVFTEPRLAALIEEALLHNSDLQTAHLQVQAAKAALRSAKGELFPSIGLAASKSKSRFKNSDFTETSSGYNIGAEASWEIDAFGRMRNAKRAAAATVEEQMAYEQAVRTELIATVATAYYQLEMYDAQIADTRSIIDSWTESIATQRVLLEVGEATSDDVDQSEAAKLEAEATLEELLLQLRQAENALCAALGRPCQHIDRDSLSASCLTIDSIPSVSIQALARRPDVRQAEAALKAAFYATNEARAALYPSLSLSGSIGWTNDVGEIVSPAGLLMNALGSLTQPLFAGGRLRAEVQRAKAEQEAAKVTFRQTVLEAGREVNDIMATEQYARRAISLSEQQVKKLSHIADASKLRMQYDEDVNYLQVLLARQALLEARLQLLAHRYEMIDAHIQLYKALGGGMD